MKRTIEELANFALNVNQKKFNKLSSKKQHELLAALAHDALLNNDPDLFLNRYEELQGWTDLDRYQPPFWLTIKEQLREYRDFHNSFSPSPSKPDFANNGLENNFSWEPEFEVSILLDQIRSPYNAGSVLRIIDNFGFKEMIHSTSTLSFDHPRLKKSARGCEKWVPVKYEDDPVQFLNGSDIPVIGLERSEDAIDIADWDPPKKCILIAGNEEYGISEAILNCCTQKVQIPMFGFKKSMNVHHALSIISQKFVEKNS